MHEHEHETGSEADDAAHVIEIPTAAPEPEATPGASAQPAVTPKPKKERRRAGFEPKVKKALTDAVRQAKKKDRDRLRNDGVDAVKRAKRKREPQFETREGAPEWEPSETDKAQIMALAGLGMSLEETAILLGISEQTLITHKAKVDKVRSNGLAIAKSRLRQAGYEQGVGGSLGHWRFYEERVFGYTPKATNEITGANGGPVDYTSTTRILSDDELIARFKTLADRTASVTAVSHTRFVQAPESPVEPL
jgi:DNA-binding CsgD family transcriptional regulator